MANNNNNSNLPTNTRKRGTGFTNISRVLDANKANRLGSTIGSGIQGKVGEVQEGLEQQSSGFQQKSQEGRLGTAEHKASRQNVLDKFSGQSGFEGVTEQDTEDFERYRSREYKGPHELDQSEFTKTYGQAQQAQKLGQQTRSAGGRESLLSRFAAQPGQSYQKGQRRLDNMLLGQTGGTPLRQARRASSSLVGQASEAAQVAREQAKQHVGEANTFGQETGEQLQGMFDPRQETIDTGRDEFLASAEAKRQVLADKLSRDEILTDEEYSAMGLGPEDIEQMKFLTDISKQKYLESVGIYGSKIINGHGRVVSGTLRGPEVGALFQGQRSGDFIPQAVRDQLGLNRDRSRGFLPIATTLGYAERPDFAFEEYLDDVDPYSITAENTANQQQLAQLNALRQLQGESQLYDESLAETASSDAAINQSVIDEAMLSYFPGMSEIYEEGPAPEWEGLSPQGQDAVSALRTAAELSTFGQTRMLDSLWKRAGLGKTGIDRPFDDTAGILADYAGDIEQDPVAHGLGYYATGGLSAPISLGAKAIDAFGGDVGSNLTKAVGTVICGELYRQGIMSTELYNKDSEFARKIQREEPEVYQGYFVWAKHVASLMKKSKLVTKLITPFGIAWANHMAGNDNKLGKTIFNIGVPICRFIGKLIRKKRVV